MTILTLLGGFRTEIKKKLIKVDYQFTCQTYGNSGDTEMDHIGYCESNFIKGGWGLVIREPRVNKNQEA